MLLENIHPRLALEELKKFSPGIEVSAPARENYDSSLWEDVKTRSFASLTETVQGVDGLWRMTFQRGKIFEIQFYLELMNSDLKFLKAPGNEAVAYHHPPSLSIVGFPGNHCHAT